MHIRGGRGEAKLVRCSYGAIFDVIVDLRSTSPTYRKQATFELRSDEQVSLYVPAGCAHGFQALTEPADVSYRVDRPHDPAEDIAIAFDDAALGIDWPLPAALLSERNRAHTLSRPQSRLSGERTITWSRPWSCTTFVQPARNRSNVRQLAATRFSDTSSDAERVK